MPPPLPPPSFDEPITALTRLGSQLAYAVRGNAHFLNLIKPSRAHVDQRVCEGTGEKVVSLAFDYARPAYLWMGTESGDLFMFDSRAKMQSASTCKLLHREANQADKPTPVSVASVRGYVVSLTGTTAEVYNTTGADAAGVRWVLSHTLGKNAGEGASATMPAARAVSVGGRMSANTQSMLVVAHIGGSDLFLHESLLPYHPQHYDIGWIRGPLLAVAVAVVVGYQILKRRGGKPAASAEDIANALRVPGADGTSFGQSRRFRAGRGGSAGGDFSAAAAAIRRAQRG